MCIMQALGWFLLGVMATVGGALLAAELSFRASPYYVRRWGMRDGE